MLNGNDPSQEDLVQNLRDAGCSAETIERFLACVRAEQEAEQLSLLNSHRRQLLENLHREEKCIDCLDYLLYRLTRGHAAAKEPKK